MNPKCARLFFAFTGASRFPWRFAFPGDSSVMSWQLAIRVSWRFPCPGDSQHVLAGRGLVVLQLQLKVGSWLLLAPEPRRLVVSGLPVSTLYLDLVDEPACLLLWLELEVEDEEWVFL